MKLLNRQEINNLKSTERQKEIEEGIKLARKIEILRETVAKEEVNIGKYRDESLKKLKGDIEKYTSIKNLLMSEIEILEEQKIYLRKKIQEVLQINN